jgi:hypothetical protein
MPRDDALIRMVGGAALAAVARNLQEASPAFRRKMPKALREAIEPARVAVEADLRRRLPHHAATVRSVIGLRSPTIANVRIVMDPKNLPPERRSLPGLMEYGSQGSGGSFIRHPVYGGGKKTRAEWTWVIQKTDPGFYRTIRSFTPIIADAMNRLMADFGKDSGFS